MLVTATSALPSRPLKSAPRRGAISAATVSMMAPYCLPAQRASRVRSVGLATALSMPSMAFTSVVDIVGVTVGVCVWTVFPVKPGRWVVMEGRLMSMVVPT